MIVAKLEANKNAFGIFGYSFLEENASKLRGVAIEGVEPSFEVIAAGKYKGSRPLSDRTPAPAGARSSRSAHPG